jgi:hypothetical protein
VYIVTLYRGHTRAITFENLFLVAGELLSNSLAISMSHSHEADDVVAVIAVVDGGKMSTTTVYICMYWYYVYICVLVLYIYILGYYMYGGGWQEMTLSLSLSLSQLLSSGDTSFEETRTNCKPAAATSFVLSSPSKEQSTTRSSSLHKQPSEAQRRDGYTERGTERESVFPAGSELHGLPVDFFV